MAAIVYNISLNFKMLKPIELLPSKSLLLSSLKIKCCGLILFLFHPYEFSVHNYL